MKHGLYDTVIDQRIARALADLNVRGMRHEMQSIAATDLPERIGNTIGHWIEQVLATMPEKERAAAAIRITEQIFGILDALDHSESYADLQPTTALASLQSVYLEESAPPKSPLTPLRSTTLITNHGGEPGIGQELATEIESADRIDLVLAFIRWSGIRKLMAGLRSHCEKGRPLRVLTTTYTNSTEPRALEALTGIGAQIKISYDTSSTRLHAKAWMFERASGFTTVYIGSSNLTHSAQVTGIEWNVRASYASNPALVDRFSATFESYWESDQFEAYDRDSFAQAYGNALRQEHATLTPFDIKPHPFQRQMLEQVLVSRREGCHRNLIVSATGTGKTIMAALDYRWLQDHLAHSRLLFVAHRKEILNQSRNTFRHVLRDGSFGELLVDGHEPREGEHVFASVQSLHAKALARMPADSFDVIVVDEFHHAAAQTYRAILAHFDPAEVLGLTATPERADGQDVLDWFGGRIAAELRLWDALEQQLLCPFQYFGIADGTDLSAVRWQNGSYGATELTNLYTANDLWVGKVLAATLNVVTDVAQMRALGFCVTVAHANFMADRFNKAGIPARAVSANTSSSDRTSALTELSKGEINVLFAVDLFNEGVDLPDVDTLLLLRPTSSATIFLQQLGRGLRRSAKKEVLTVLDFVGQQHIKFRFDQKFGALLSPGQSSVKDAVEAGFPNLPAGCQITLDRQSTETILASLRHALPSNVRQRAAELRTLGTASLADYLAQSGLQLEDVYRGNHYWTKLQRLAQTGSPPPEAQGEEPIGRAIGRMLHINDTARIDFLLDRLSQVQAPAAPGPDTLEARQLNMFFLGLMAPIQRDQLTLESAATRLWRHPALISELCEVLRLLRQRITHLSDEQIALGVPLRLHAHYSRDEILAAYGAATVERPNPVQTGVYWHEASHTNLLFVNLDKSDTGFSPNTRYKDYAINDHLFHWESQASTSASSTVGRRYLEQRSNGSKTALFVRERRHNAVGSASAYCCLGLVDYVSHRGERPIAIKWALRTPMPGDVFSAFRAAVA